MTTPIPDDRSPARRATDEQIAAEPKLAVPKLPADAKPQPVEALLGHHRPVAVPGVVENGLVRPLDPAIKLSEHARVIIIATAPN